MAYKDPDRQREYQRMRAERKRRENGIPVRGVGSLQRKLRERVNKLKDMPCVDCGGRFHYAAMDYDHVSGDKIAGVSEMLRGNCQWDMIADEIAKCDLVCANCHRIRTFERR